MARGGKREGAGRKAGSVTTKTRETADRAAAEGLTPLDYMLKILRDEEQPKDARMWAAEKAAPYVHAKLANVELNANVAFSHEDALDQLDDDGAGEGDQAEAED